MLTLNTKLTHADKIDGELVLPFELREKSRFRAQLVSGETVAVFTERGTILRDADLMRGDDGRVVRIRSAKEAIYRVECSTAQTLLRCAFHLGNRHTQAQIGTDARGGFLRIRRDPVLRDMLAGLGAIVTEEDAAFEPEAGAYGGGHHHGEQLLAPVPLRQKIHRPFDKRGESA